MAELLRNTYSEIGVILGEKFSILVCNFHVKKKITRGLNNTIVYSCVWVEFL